MSNEPQDRLQPSAIPAWLTGGGVLLPLIASIDWSTTPLGPVAGWPQSLRTALSICLNSRFPIAIWWGPHGIQFYNEAYLPVVGAKHPGSMGQPAAECWAEAWPVVGPLYDQVLTTGESTWSEDLRIPMRRFGFDEESYFTFSYSAIRDETGGVGGLQVTCIETTDRVLSERRLQTLRALSAHAGDTRTVTAACEAAIRAIAAAPADVPFAAMYLLDSDRRRATFVGAAHLAGDAACPATIDLSTTESEGGWPIREVALSGRWAIVDDVIERFGRLPSGPWSDPPRTAVVLPVAQPGQSHPAAVLVAGVSPAKPLDDAYRGFFELLGQGLAATIANARAYEDERRRAEELAALDRAKTTFFSNVSHEFRTPLTLMLGPLEETLAHRDALAENHRERIELAHRNSLRLLKLVNSLLDFSRIEAGRIQAVYEPVDLAALTAELASVFRSAIENAGLRLIVECSPLAEPVYVDRDMWEKIVLNLLSNAFKFTFDGQIGVTLRQIGPAVTLTVTDTGTGIPEADLPHVFERFHRVTGARGRSYEGSGIGLAMVQELVRLHGGSVWVESAVDRGSTFTVTIPTGHAHLPADRINTARTLASTSLGAAPFIEEALRWLPNDAQRPAKIDAIALSETSRAPANDAPHGQLDSTRRPRIVWADDNADMRAYVSRLLASSFDVEAVPDGRSALAAIARDVPDLVLADVMMPGLDGFDVLQAVRNNSTTTDVPVVLLSARAGEESRVEGMASGADDYLIKPFSARELLARVEAHVKLGRLRRELATKHQTEAALRASEERQAFLVRFSDAVRGLADPVEVATTACRMLLEQLDVDRAHWAEVDWTTEEFVTLGSVHSTGVAPISGRFPLAAWEPYSASHRKGRPVVVDDTQTDPRTDSAMRAAAARMDVGADLAAPVLVGGRLASVLAVKQRQPRRWTREEIALVEGVAGRCWAEVERARAVVALRASEQKYRSLFEWMGQGYSLNEIVRDAEGAAIDLRYLELNPAFERLTGASLSEARGRLASEVFPGLDRYWVDICDRAATTGVIERVEHELTPNGRWYESNFYPIGRDRVLSLYDDITDRKRAELALRESEARQAFLLGLADALRPLADPVAIQVEAARVLGRHLGASRAMYAEVEADDAHFVVHRDYTDGAPSLAGRHLLDAFGPAFIRDHRAGRTLTMTDVTRDERVGETRLAAFAAAGIAAFVGVPLVKGGRLVASLSVHFPEPHEWRPAEVALVEETAERTWAAVERARAESALRVSEARYRTIFESIDEGFAVAEVLYDAEGRPVDLLYLEANPAASRLTGGTVFAGRRASEVLPEADRTSLQIYDSVARTGKAERVERYYASFDRWYEGHISPVIAGEPVGTSTISRRVAIVFRDVTERRRAVEALRASEARQSFLLTLADALRPLADPVEIQVEATRVLGRHLGASRANYAEVEADDAHFLVHRDYTDGVGSMAGSYPLDAFGPEFGRDLRAGRSVTVADVARDERVGETRAPLFAAVQISAFVGVPLVKGGRLAAVLSVHFPKPHEWSPVEVALIEETAERTWAAVERARAEAALRESEEKYRSLFERMDEGFAICELVRDADGRAIDYRYVELNPAVVRHVGIEPTALIGRRASEVFQRLDPWLMKTYEHVVATGESVIEEHHFAHVDRWLRINAFPRGGNRFAVLYSDITERKRTELALRESEIRYRTLFETMGQGYSDLELLRDPDGRIVDERWLALNPAFERIFGIPVERAVGRRRSEIFPGLEPWWEDTFDRVARSGVPERVEYESPSIGGWYEMWVYPRGGDRLTVLYEDVTERKRGEVLLRDSEQRQAFLLRLADALRPLADPLEIQRTAMRVLGEQLQVDRVLYSEIDDGEATYVIADNYVRGNHPKLVGRFPTTDFGAATELLRAGKTVVVADVASDERLSEAARASFLAFGVHASIGVPLIKDHRWVANLGVQHAAPREWPADEVALLEETAERTWAAVERARAEAALRASEEQFRRSIEEAPIPIIMHAEDGEVLQISRTWTELTGWTLEEVPTFDAWLTRAYGQGADAVREHVRALFAGIRRTMSMDFPVRTRDGDLRHWSFSASAPGTLRDGRRFVVGMALDVTERRRAEHALRASEERLRTVIESIQDYAIITLDPDGRITSWNDGARRITGYEADEVLGGPVDRFYPPESVVAGKPARELQHAIDTGRSEDESWRVRKDGSRLWVNEIVRPLRDSDGRVTGFAKISRDLTERKAFEDALQQAHDSLEARVRERTGEVQSLFTRLVSAQEEERRRIARDIHDHVGQQMTALRMNIAALRAHADSASAAEQAKRTETLAEELDHAIDFLTWELRPAALDHLGLPGALAHLVSGWSERFGIQAEYDTFGIDGARFSPAVETNLYRLTQEALHNVYKHAHATRVSVLLERRDGRLSLVVEDDGEGFTPASQKRVETGSLGLINMRERATLAGGQLTIDSTPGHGTTVIVRVPVRSEGGGPNGETETPAR